MQLAMAIFTTSPAVTCRLGDGTGHSNEAAQPSRRFERTHSRTSKRHLPLYPAIMPLPFINSSMIHYFPDKYKSATRKPSIAASSSFSSFDIWISHHLLFSLYHHHHQPHLTRQATCIPEDAFNIQFLGLDPASR